MSEELKTCPILLEFAGMPGFPAAPAPENWYRWYSRTEEFKRRLETITSAAARETNETGTPISAAFCRHLSALLALSSMPYEAAPVEQPEPAPPADPVDELDTPPAREEEIR